MGEETSGGTRVKHFYERQIQSLVTRRKMRIIVYSWEIGKENRISYRDVVICFVNEDIYAGWSS